MGVQHDTVGRAGDKTLILNGRPGRIAEEVGAPSGCDHAQPKQRSPQPTQQPRGHEEQGYKRPARSVDGAQDRLNISSFGHSGISIVSVVGADLD